MRQILIFAVLVSVAWSQDAPHAVSSSVLDLVKLPGEIASTSGQLSSYEKGNIVADTYVEQKAVVSTAWNDTLTLSPYVSAEFVLDTSGYNWNNKVSPSLGLKISKHLRAGVISAGIGYMYENRFRNADGFKPTGGRIDFLSDWFGWNDVTEKANRFPGSTWGIIGHFSPVEAGNLIERSHVQQGYVLQRFGSMAVIPFAEATVGHDSKRFDWENIAMVGTGMKVGMPRGKIYTEIGASYLRETRLISDRTARGLTVFVNVSSGWSLFGRK
jgi:hypothetical protein